MGTKRRKLGLRTRATLAFGITGLLVAIGLAAVTYGIARGYLVEQRERAAERQSYVNARLARTVLRSSDADLRGFLDGLGGGAASNSLLRHQGEWFSTSVAVGPDALPAALVALVSTNHAGHQRFRSSDGELYLAVGVPLSAVEASYFEVFTLNELDRTLDVLARSLLFGVIAAALVAAAVGRIAAAQLVRPLAPIADAAQQIAGGALDTRLTGIDDPDLRRLTEAFNSMATALEARVERERRFAADVSHELRSPLTAVAAAVAIIERRRDQLPPQVVRSFTVLAEKVETFQQMVLDLLEISRLDAGTAALSLDDVELRHFVNRLLALHGADAAEVEFADDVPAHIQADRRRLEQALGNIVDNAARYAGGVTRVAVYSIQPGHIRFELDDRGPGVAPEERERIFARFARGEAGVQAGATSGTGLGLSLVAEHIRLHGGRVWIEDNPAGGARFVIELPTEHR
jgi:signal transduction histidine kinase